MSMYISLLAVGVPVNYNTEFLQIILANSSNFFMLLYIGLVVDNFRLAREL
jgi:hypothetical protein